MKRKLKKKVHHMKKKLEEKSPMSLKKPFQGYF